jgi:hypothetical protein
MAQEMQTRTSAALREKSPPAPLALRIGFWACIVIAVAVVVRRLAALLAPASSSPPQMAELDSAFANHAALTLAHILPALVFVLLAPIVLFRRTARFAWAEQLLYPVGAIVGITAYAMSRYSVGGWLERSAVLLFNTLFLYSLWQAFQEHADPKRKRRWLVRSIVILLGIATTRPVMGVFFATSRLTHLQPNQFFGIAFWIGFSLNWAIVELWLRKRRTA